MGHSGKVEIFCPSEEELLPPEFKDKPEEVIETSRRLPEWRRSSGSNEGTTLGNWVNSTRREHAGEETAALDRGIARAAPRARAWRPGELEDGA